MCVCEREREIKTTVPILKIHQKKEIQNIFYKVFLSSQNKKNNNKIKAEGKKIKGGRRKGKKRQRKKVSFNSRVVSVKVGQRNKNTYP